VLIATIKPRGLPGKTRRRLAVELIGELEAIDRKIKAVEKELVPLVIQRGPTLLDLHGIGPADAARLLADDGGIHRFAKPGPVRVLERHRTPGRLLRQPAATPSVPRRQPAHQPRAAHHGHRTTAPRHRRPRLLRPPQSRRDALDDGHPRPHTPTVQRRLRPHTRRPTPTRSDEPGRAIREPLCLQRGRLTPQHRLFGQATSRTRHQQA
jgi:hypothetical protein